VKDTFSFVPFCTEIEPYDTTIVIFSSGMLTLHHPLHILVLILDMNETIYDIFEHNREQSKSSHCKWA